MLGKYYKMLVEEGFFDNEKFKEIVEKSREKDKLTQQEGYTKCYKAFIDMISKYNGASIVECVKAFPLKSIEESTYNEETMYVLDMRRNGLNLDAELLLSSMAFYVQLLIEGFLLKSPVCCKSYLDNLTSYEQSSGAVRYTEYLKILRKLNKFNKDIDPYGFRVELREAIIKTKEIRNSNLQFITKTFDSRKIDYIQGLSEDIEDYDNKIRFIYSFIPYLNNERKCIKVAYVISTQACIYYFMEDFIEDKLVVRSTNFVTLEDDTFHNLRKDAIQYRQILMTYINSIY